MMKECDVEFHSTGEGHILCIRPFKNGSGFAKPIKYELQHPMPMPLMLDAKQQEEWRLTLKMEWEHASIRPGGQS